jgi:MFS transporter, ACDE family, multidrug resistance protein
VFARRLFDLIRGAPAPGPVGFALLTAMDAGARGTLISVFPLLMYRSLGSAEKVSAVYLVAGVLALATALLIPWATRWIPRRWVFTAGTACYVLGSLLVLAGDVAVVPLVLPLYTSGTVTIFLCLNAYVLDRVTSADLGRTETLRMFYSALGWTVGPFAGVWLVSVWTPLPFLVSAAFGAILCALFWRMRLGDGRMIRRSRAPATNPLAYLARFAAQPRLVAGYLFAMIRSCGWWVYVIYLPIFAIQSGLGDKTGGIALSLSNSLLFLTPLMLRWTRRRPVRAAVRVGFLGSALLFCAATLFYQSPWVALACLFLGSAFLILLDICGGLPFLMAVKPSERTEMSAVYSSFRDVSGIVAPGIATVVLLIAPVHALFGVAGLGLFAAWGIAGRIPPRLGAGRPPVSHQRAA